MKATLCAILTVGWAVVACAQGLIELDTYNNFGTGPDATSHGLFWLSSGGSTALINQDFNAGFYLGTDPSHLDLLALFLLSDGSAVGDNALGPGTFTDVNGTGYVIPGYHPYVFMRVQAWTGNFDSYAAAIAGGASAGESPVFTNMVAYGTIDPPGLVGMPAVILTLPEPPVGHLLLLALAGLLLRRAMARLPTAIAFTRPQSSGRQPLGQLFRNDPGPHGGV